jgi:hypothetical protein
VTGYGDACGPNELGPGRCESDKRNAIKIVFDRNRLLAEAVACCWATAARSARSDSTRFCGAIAAP